MGRLNSHESAWGLTEQNLLDIAGDWMLDTNLALYYLASVSFTSYYNFLIDFCLNCMSEKIKVNHGQPEIALFLLAP